MILKENDISKIIVEYFNAKSQNTAEVLAGPKRETWFSSEIFRALSLNTSHNSQNPHFPNYACYGEQSYNKIFQTVKSPIKPNSLYRPDIVIYEPDIGESSIKAILEVKLILEKENPDKSLEDLNKQLMFAKNQVSDALVLGVIFISAVPFITPGTFQKTVSLAKERIENKLPDSNYSWVSGYECLEIFPPTLTNFFYPSMKVPLYVGLRKLNK